ncbi:MAG: 50S ribosomal protein L6 [Candidatus Sericytochromatia bacterium]|nr:50S ribosomal protein L6 [Candidatus Sericytochromatia bacterium]
MSQSRIGKRPITVPASVKVEISAGRGTGQTVLVTGPKGSLSRTLRPEVSVSLEDGVLLVSPGGDTKTARSLHGLSRTLVFNMVEGVTNGFKKVLEINGVGYRAAVAGSKLTLQMGYSHPVEIEAPAGITFTVPPGPKPSVVVEGIDKQLVGDMAAKVRSVRPPEPYKGKGIKYDYEVIRRKAGKSGGKKK